MRLVRAALAAVIAGCAALALGSSGRASDHLDSPRAVANPPADIADLFVFTSPENPRNVVLAMTAWPYAGRSAMFSPDIDYVFRIRRVVAPNPFTLDTTVLDVTCRFDRASLQGVLCRAPGGLQVQAALGDTTGGQAAPLGSMRVFAGLRSDPAFFDRQGALATLVGGRSSFGGQNAFAGANVLALVVEVDALAAFAPDRDAGVPSEAGAAPLLAVAAETVRSTP